MPKGLLVGLVVLLVLVLACGATVVAGTLIMGLHRTNQAAKIVPADTTLFISASPTLRHLPQLQYWDNVTKAGAVFGALPGASDVADLFEDDGLTGLDVDVQQDILPWIGREVSAAVTFDGPYGDPQLIVVASARNERAARAFMDKIRGQLEEEDFLFKESTYRRVQVTEVVEPAYMPWGYATFEHMVVFATDVDVLKDAIDAGTGGSASVLYEDRSFREALDALPAGRLGYVYMDWPTLAEDADMDLDLEGLGDLPIASWRAVESVALAPGLSRDGLRLDYAVQYNTRRLSSDQEAVLGQSASKNRLTGVVPADTLVYLSGQDLARVAETLAKGEFGQEVVEEILWLTGVDLVDDVLSEMPGEYALLAAPDADGLMGETDVPLGLLFYGETQGQRKVERSLEDLAEALAEEGDLAFYSDEIGGVPVWLIGDERSDITLGYGFVEGFAFVGSSLNVIELATESASLSDSDLFQRTIRQLPDKNRGYVYVDLQRGIDTIYDIMHDYDRDAFDEDIRPHIESILAIGVASEPMTSDGTVRGALFIHTDGE